MKAILGKFGFQVSQVLYIFGIKCYQKKGNVENLKNFSGVYLQELNNSVKVLRFNREVKNREHFIELKFQKRFYFSFVIHKAEIETFWKRAI